MILKAITFMGVFPWVLNGLSLITAHCLSNQKVVIGRSMGVAAAIGWSIYGYLIGEWSFIISNIIFFYIYASALIKFNKKKSEYQHSSENIETQLLDLLSEQDKRKLKGLRLIEQIEKDMIELKSTYQPKQ
jgi:hypothetical protein